VVVKKNPCSTLLHFILSRPALTRNKFEKELGIILECITKLHAL
jgi:hypothetical protein